ncbi:Hypothetical protein FKW44_009567 [Caligus rogercresseyi]|uniref:Uncharacterized protein n=1 Tax=Caligus rogercresseyi TaxID=217165 RepID=A0A7T8HFC8_CALRO|nr:Hypothetical protein FKW44_009567 [Caligus rogercresseyi]
MDLHTCSRKVLRSLTLLWRILQPCSRHATRWKSPGGSSRGSGGSHVLGPVLHVVSHHFWTQCPYARVPSC